MRVFLKNFNLTKKINLSTLIALEKHHGALEKHSTDTVRSNVLKIQYSLEKLFSLSSIPQYNRCFQQKQQTL